MEILNRFCSIAFRCVKEADLALSTFFKEAKPLPAAPLIIKKREMFFAPKAVLALRVGDILSEPNRLLRITEEPMPDGFHLVFGVRKLGSAQRFAPVRLHRQHVVESLVQ